MSSWPRHSSQSPFPGDRRVALVVASDLRGSFPVRVRPAGHVIQDLHDVLADPTMGGFEVHLVLDQPVHQVRTVVDEVISTREAGDLLLVYVLCPGMRDRRGRLFFAAADTRADRLASTGVDVRWLFDQLDQSPAARQVVIIDSWLNDGAGDIGTWEPDLGVAGLGLGRHRSLVILTALWAGETGYGFEPESDAVAMPEAVFTDALVAGIRSGAADADRDGEVSVEEAYEYAVDRLRTHDIAVTPQRRQYGAGENMIFAHTDNNRPIARVGTDPERADTGDDQLSDAAEASLGTDPTLADNDQDGLFDGCEVAGPVTDRLGRAVDENVQFTVYRPRTVRPAVWYPLLAFAHLSERRGDAPPDELDPVDQVKALAARALGHHALSFAGPTSDARAAVPKSGELTLVPTIEGVAFNPPRRSFSWVEDVHKEEFRLRADSSRDGSVVRGRLTVYLGFFILADVDLAIRVDGAAAAPPAPGLATLLSSTGGDVDYSEPLEPVHAIPYRKVFLSYSHKDTAIVEQAERLGRAIGDVYLRDRTMLLAGEHWHPRLLELIDEADVFQLFWSRTSMRSRYVQQEWEHALTVDKPFFVRPTYWEDPFPSSDAPELPPPALKALHFHALTQPAADDRHHPAVTSAEYTDPRQLGAKICGSAGRQTRRPPTSASIARRSSTSTTVRALVLRRTRPHARLVRPRAR
jgi:hypothetical protein